MKVDAQQKEGKKPLNEEQLVLLTNRGTVEKALNDMEAIKAQLEEIAKEDVSIISLHQCRNSLIFSSR